ncbi:MAG: NAD(P)/FAD-dependent oxidoreductase, partial [Halieaceae bacterium]|nr:NAD(P)/FAD-dependent oxidoreductase [Halieaceae bacterium]
MDSSQFDAIVIGAGHNGLTTANYLALGGQKVCVLEQRHIVGGAVVSEEFHPGYRNSIASYVVSLLRPEVIKELELKKYGFQPLPLNNSFYPSLNGDYLLLTDNEEHNKKQYAKFSDTDYDAVKAFNTVVEKVGDLIASQWLKEPPKLYGGGLSDLISSARLGIDLYKLEDDTRWRFLQFFMGAPDSIIERWFDSDKVKAMVAAHCMPANYISLYHPGASLAMLHHAVGELDGRKGAWGLVKGGMGAITQAMAA